MAFTGRLRFLYPLAKAAPLIAASGFGLGFGTVSAAEQFERPGVPLFPGVSKSKLLNVPELHVPGIPEFGELGELLPVPKPAHPVPILKISSSEIKINTSALNSVLDKIGNRPFAIYSVNGPARTGKSFLLNYFLRYLRWKSDDHRKKDNQNWMEKAYRNEFVWKGETVRCTLGINIWSEPFEVMTKDGSKVPVLLMDCQGAFDDQTSMNQNAIIFAISTLLSSVLIFNIMKQIEESVMQFLEVFAEYASAVSTVERRANAASSSSFQSLIILVRDFDFQDYKLGHHSNTSTPGGHPKNYKRDKVDPHSYQPSEIESGRMSIINAFNDVSVYLMPEPGRPLRREDRADQLEPDFRLHLQDFVESTLDPEKIVIKRVNGAEVTATEFKDYIDAWSKFDWSREMPEIQTIRKLTEEVYYQHAKKAALDVYQMVMKPYREFEYRQEEKDLLVIHERAMAEARQIFAKKRKIGGTVNDDRFEIEFTAEAERFWDDIKTLNRTKQWNTYWAKIVSYVIVGAGPVLAVLWKIWGSGIF